MALVSVKNPDDALDIVQDVMLALSRKYAARPADQWTPLFFRMLGNRIQDFHRRGNLRRRFFGWLGSEDIDPQDVIEDTRGPQSDEPEHWLEIDHSTARLKQALGNLPPRQQQAFMLRAWQGMDVKETAEVMACSQGSVKTHYARAVQALRQQLPEFGSDQPVQAN